MRPVIRALKEDHRLIGRAAACLDRLADDALDSEDVCIGTAIDLLEFFEEFADGAHQEKEERHLFPALLRSGLATHRVLDLVEDHQREREVLREMWGQLERAAHGDSASRDEFALAALDYASMQREHALEENEILLPLAEELLDEDTERAVLAGFRQVEEDALPKPAESYVALVEEAAARLGSSIWSVTSPSLELQDD